LALGEVQDFRSFPGEGAIGTVILDGSVSQTLAGTADFLSRHSVDIAAAAEMPSPDAGDTVVLVAWGGRVRARASLADTARPEAAEAVRSIASLGLAVELLSGDREAACAHLAGRIGIDRVKAERDPAAKIAAIRAMRTDGSAVALVGDGINDAPALAEADIGIAMGAGADLAREVGDVVLLRNDLLAIPWLVKLARQTRLVIRQNLLWAFGYNLVAMTVAFFGYLHPLVAAAIMLGSSLFVIRNSLKLRRGNPASTQAATPEAARAP
jgi:P-type E1-E2 ATPase